MQNQAQAVKVLPEIPMARFLIGKPVSQFEADWCRDEISHGLQQDWSAVGESLRQAGYKPADVAEVLMRVFHPGIDAEIKADLSVVVKQKGKSKPADEYFEIVQKWFVSRATKVAPSIRQQARNWRRRLRS